MKPTVDSREGTFRELIAIVPLVIVILALALYPQFVLKRTEPSARAAIASAQAQSQRSAIASTAGWTAYAPLKTASAP